MPTNVDPTPALERVFPNQLESLGQATEEAVNFLQQQGLAQPALYAANLAIEELGTNILKYGYDDPGAHEIRLRLEVHATYFLISLEDDGHEFNPLLSPAPDLTLGVEERQPGGLGLALVRQFSDQVDYQRLAGRNRVTIRISR